MKRDDMKCDDRKPRIAPSDLISMLLQLLTASCMVAGITLTAQMGGGFMGGGTAFLYFTVQSNLWIGAACALFFVLNVIALVRPSFSILRVLHIIKFVFTVSITLTGIVFCCVLAPTLPGSFQSAANVLTHVVVPIAAVADLFLCRPQEIAYKQFAFALIPPIYYLCFAGIGYALHWDFGGGNNYPYFFLNWDSPAGAFGFSSEMPYFMGCFYWIVVMIAFISLLSLGYIAGSEEVIESCISGAPRRLRAARGASLPSAKTAAPEKGSSRPHRRLRTFAKRPEKGRFCGEDPL